MSKFLDALGDNAPIVAFLACMGLLALCVVGLMVNGCG